MGRLYSMNLNQMLLEFGLMLKDAALMRVSTQANPNEVIVNRLAFGDADRYQNAEAFLWDKPSDMTAENPLLVRTSDGNGKLTFTEAVGPTAVAAGARFVLQNFGGKGHPHALKEQALRFALLEQGAVRRASVVIGTPEQGTDWQTIPEGLDSVIRVVISDDRSPAAPYETEVSPAVWNDIDLDGRRIRLPYDFNVSGRSVTIYGRVNVDYPWLNTTNYTLIMDVEPTNLIKDAHIWLLLDHRDEKSASVMANLYNDKLRTRRDLPLPGEVFLN